MKLPSLLCLGATLVGSLRLSQPLRPRSASLRAIDVSGLPVDLSATDILQSANLRDAATATQNALILLFGVGYILNERRPRGNAKTDLVEIRRSSVPKANLGVFTRTFVPKGTVLGTYPGFARDPEDALRSKVSDAARESAKRYMWMIADDLVLDPTNEQGQLELEIPYLSGLYRANTLMARINEPPPRADCNLITRVSGVQVELVAERDLFADEELFIDYGSLYDRRDYVPEEEQERERLREQARRRQEKEAMLTLQPITDSEDDLDTSHRKRTVVDQDTSRSDGFISRLRKKDEGSKQAGLIDPEEAADMFSTLGSGMFNQKSGEDSELMSR